MCMSIWMVYRVAVMIFQSAYSEAYELTQKMLLRHSNSLLVSALVQLNLTTAWLSYDYDIYKLN